jgi:DtxR family Mn-dependent transcriptional regulator
MQSENAEMYLVHLAMLEESGIPTPVPLPRLAEELDVQTVSANQMIRKLEEDGLVNYQPYKGVSFTEKGRKLVQNIIRHRRLWEVFFVEKLGFTPHRADELACRMEHITQPEVAARLSDYLGNPAASPSGKPIPTSNDFDINKSGVTLKNLQPGARAEILSINADPSSSAYLMAENFTPGTIFTIEAVSSRGVFLLSHADQRISVSANIAGKINVSPYKDA